MATIFDIDEKLRQYLEGTASQEVRDQVQEWAASDPDHQAQLEKLTALWGGASGSALYREIDPHADWQKVQQRLQSSDSAPSGRTSNSSPPAARRRIWAIAATILLLASLSFFILHDTGEPQMMLAETGADEQVVHLADGSEVTLRPHSRLRYPETFARDQRLLELEAGSAFFDVERNPKKPFVVDAGPSMIEVKGTSFSVKRLEKSTEVAVRTGKVRFYMPDNAKADILLLPGQKANLSLNQGTLADTLTAPNEFAWVSDTLVFDHTPLAEVFASLEEVFNLEFSYGDDFDLSRGFTSNFVDAKIEEVMEELKIVVGLSYRIENDKVFVE